MFMQIYWHGLSCIRIEASNGDETATLVTDPYDYADTGLRFPRTLEPQVAVFSHQDRSRFPADAFKNQPFMIADPGEYEVQGMFVFGMPVKDADDKSQYSLAYRFEIEGISVGFLGGAKRALHEEIMSRLENIDILLLPVGGGDRMNAKQAAETVQVIEPRIVIPMYYDIPDLKLKLDSVDAFCKEVGAKRQDANKLKITRKDLPAEDLIVTVLERS